MIVKCSECFEDFYLLRFEASTKKRCDKCEIKKFKKGARAIGSSLGRAYDRMILNALVGDN